MCPLSTSISSRECRRQLFLIAKSTCNKNTPIWLCNSLSNQMLQSAHRSPPRNAPAYKCCKGLLKLISCTEIGRWPADYRPPWSSANTKSASIYSVRISRSLSLTLTCKQNTKQTSPIKTYLSNSFRRKKAKARKNRKRRPTM